MNEGKKDRRDPIRTIKTKNPVAKNASAAIGGGAAGAHKDKKRAMKAGEVKHKKAEYAESYEQHLQNKLNEATKVDPNAPFNYDAWSKSGKPFRKPGKAIKQLAQQTRAELAKKKEQGVAEGFIKDGANWNSVLHSLNVFSDVFVDPLAPEESDIAADPKWSELYDKVTNSEYAHEVYSKVVKLAKLGVKLNPNEVNTVNDLVWDGGNWESRGIDWLEDLYQQQLGAVMALLKQRDQGQNTTKSNHTIHEQGVAEEVDQGEYSDEVGMVKTNLHTIARMCLEIMKTMQEGENLPEWFEEKISQAKGMIVSAGDYLISQHEQGDIDVEGYEFSNTPKTQEKNTKNTFVQRARHAGLPEGQSALEKFRKGSAEREKKHADIEAKRKAAPPGSGMSAAIDRLKKQVKGEGWTHDSLADRLFEHERTYEEQLQSKLNKVLGK